jgi:hypothetical protein
MVFQNRVLREISGTEEEEVTGEWRRLHNEEHHYMYLSPDIILMMKSRRMRLSHQCGHTWRRK